MPFIDSLFSWVQKFPTPLRQGLRLVVWYTLLVPQALWRELRFRKKLESVKNPVPLFPLPNGEFLRFAMPWQNVSGGPFAKILGQSDFPYFEKSEFLLSWNVSAKNLCLKADLWSAPGDIGVVQADFDDLRFEADEYWELLQGFSETSLLLQSFSGKTHVMFLLRFPPSRSRLEFVVEFFRSVFPEALFQRVDLNQWACSRSFLDHRSIPRMSAGLRELPVWEQIGEKQFRPTSTAV